MWLSHWIGHWNECYTFPGRKLYLNRREKLSVQFEKYLLVEERVFMDVERKQMVSIKSNKEKGRPNISIKLLRNRGIWRVWNQRGSQGIFKCPQVEKQSMYIRICWFYGIMIVGYGLVSKMHVRVFLRKYYSLRETRFVTGISINVVLWSNPEGEYEY